MRIIDLSPRVGAEAPVWPGDEPFGLASRWSIGSGDSVTVGTVTTTTHVGAHIDAPAHIVDGAGTVETTPLDACVGPCLVIDVSDLVAQDLAPHGAAPADSVRRRVLERTGGAPVERLLLRHYAESPIGWDPSLPGVDLSLIHI